MRNLKRVLSLALALVMVLGMMVITTSAADFNDADEITYTEALDVMAGVGLFKGDDLGNVNPTDVLTRKDAAVLLTRIMMGSKYNNLSDDTARQVYSDVPAGEWYSAEVEYCTNNKLIAGNGDGTFAPDGQLTGIAFAKLILCAMGYDAAAQGYVGDNWATSIYADAVDIGLDLSGVDMTKPLTREGAAQMILQALEGDMVKYTNAYDYSTGAAVVIGPEPTGETFMEEYFPKLDKTAGGNEAVWGRPYEYEWEYDGEVIHTAWYTPVKTYTTEVAECDIAADLKLKADGKVTMMFENGLDIAAANEAIEREFAHWKTIGAQGRLTEIYKIGKVYEIVMIDTYLATVTDVTEIEYDKNAHETIPAELTIEVYMAYGEDELVQESYKADYEYEVGDMLLVNIDADGEFYVVDYADSMVGAQTVFTTNDDTHIVEDEEYYDAVEFNLDEAGNETTDHTWYFDQYGNLIGVTNIRAKSAYGVISSIYWKDSRDGETGYAVATITYMDGTSETVKVAKINNVTLEGVEGKGSDYVLGLVSSTKQYNTEANATGDDFTNVALYEIKSGRYGLELTEVDGYATDAVIETGVPALNTTLTAGKSTQFLVWDADDEVYETYTGIRNVPTYDGTNTIWYVNGRDGVTDLVFVIDPTDAAANAEVTYYWNTSLTVKTYLKNSAREYYAIIGGYVNGEKATIYTKDADIVDTLLGDCKDTLLFLGLTNDYVTSVAVVDNTETGNEIGLTKTYAVYAGPVASATLADGILMADGEAYDVDDAALINNHGYSLAKTFTKVEDGAIKANEAYLYVVYTNGRSNTKIASLVYVSDVAPAAIGGTALTKAQNAAIAAYENLIDATAETVSNWAPTAAAAAKAASETAIKAMTNVAALETMAANAAVGDTHWSNVIRPAVQAANADAAATVTVTTLSDLAQKAADASVKTIKLGANIALTNTLDLNGKNLDGAGYTISAPYNMTADSGKDAIKTTGGKISNLTIVGGWRGVEATTLTADLVLENVTILDSVRALHVESGGSTKYALTATDCVFSGKLSWDSSRVSAATFTNCSFKAPGVSPKEDIIDFYTATLFDGCDFETGFAFSFADLKAIGSFAKVELVDCTVDGVAVADATYDLRTADFVFGA